MDVDIKEPTKMGLGMVEVEWSLNEGRNIGFTRGWGRRRTIAQAMKDAAKKIAQLKFKEMETEYSVIPGEEAMLYADGIHWYVTMKVVRHIPGDEEPRGIASFIVSGLTAKEALARADSSIFYGETKWKIIHEDIKARLGLPNNRRYVAFARP